MPRAKERRTSRLWLTQHAARKTQSNCDAAVDAATDGARPAPRPEVIAVAAEVCPPARRSNWAPPERLAGGRERPHRHHVWAPQAVTRGLRWPRAAQRHSRRAHGTAPRHDQGACEPR